MIALKKVDEGNYRKILDMKLTPPASQFVAPNVVSLAQAWVFYERARPLAIELDGEPIGFIMLDWDEAKREAGVWRLMIAEEARGKGYGREAMKQALQMIRESGKFDSVCLDYVPGNEVAKHLYETLGFAETGEVDDGEIIMRMRL